MSGGCWVGASVWAVSQTCHQWNKGGVPCVAAGVAAQTCLEDAPSLSSSSVVVTKWGLMMTIKMSKCRCWSVSEVSVPGWLVF